MKLANMQILSGISKQNYGHILQPFPVAADVFYILWTINLFHH